MTSETRQLLIHDLRHAAELLEQGDEPAAGLYVALAIRSARRLFDWAVLEFGLMKL